MKWHPKLEATVFEELVVMSALREFEVVKSNKVITALYKMLLLCV